MIIQGNTIIAENGKELFRKADNWCFGTELTLGYTYYIGGKKLDEPKLEVPEDYEEHFAIYTDGGVAAVDELDYKVIKTEVVKLKYSNDDQIALMLNWQANPEAYQERYDEMQAWRDYAGEVARKYANI